MSFVYLATPYTHQSAAVREYRFQISNRVAAVLMRQGMHVFSPISHSHPIAMAGELPTAWQYWAEYDEKIIVQVCSRLLVIDTEGWRESTGVRAEVAIARKHNIPTAMVSVEGVIGGDPVSFD